jgi:hypothetical protein
MQRILAIALVLVSTLFVAGTSSAQEHRVKATVPFSFTVGDFTLPAGTYTIGSSANSPDVLVLRNLEKNIKIVTTGRSNQSNPQNIDALVFHTCGNKYFLSQIRSEGASINIDFSATRAEKRAWTQYTVARRLVDAPVLIALNR